MPLEYDEEGYCPDYELNNLVYGPRSGFAASQDGKVQCKIECYYIRTMENRWARPVKMEDGKWVAYASYCRKGE
jgi:hypothetical protein